jgi:hypothetical protein
MHSEERNFLKVTAIVSRRFQAVESELGSNVLCSQFSAAGAWTATLKQIKRKKPHVSANLFRINRCRGGASGGRQALHHGN